MRWTTPTDLQAQVHKLWDRGLLLASVAGGESVFPRRLALKGPDSRALGERFSEVRDWIAGLIANEGLYRIEWRSVNHRVLGANRIPSAIWIDTLEQALGLIGKHRAAERFAGMVERTRETRAELIPWLAKRPLRALALAEDWPQLLAIVDWLRAHPRPGVYLRQVDLAGVHTKFIESQRAVLTELLDQCLPAQAIDPSATGLSGFCRRYGFKDKPLRIRPCPVRARDCECGGWPVAARASRRSHPPGMYRAMAVPPPALATRVVPAMSCSGLALRGGCSGR